MGEMRGVRTAMVQCKTKPWAPHAGVMLILGTAWLLAAASCTSARVGPASPQGASSLDTFVHAMQLVEYDYDPAPDPGSLAARSDIVVRGAIVSVTQGRSSAPSPELPADTVTSVLEVHVDEVLAGDLTLVHEGSVYVEVDHPALIGTGKAESEEGGGGWVPFDLASFAKSVPIGVPGAFFLIDVTDRTMSGWVIDTGAGRPEGARILMTHIQGFLLEPQGGLLVSVNEPLDLMPDAWQDLDDMDGVVRSVAAASR